MSRPLVIEARNALSGRSAIVSEDGDSVWLYLTAPTTYEVERDCWLFNTPSAEADPDFAQYRARSLPPPVPRELLLQGGVIDTSTISDWQFYWSPGAIRLPSALTGMRWALFPLTTLAVSLATSPALRTRRLTRK